MCRSSLRSYILVYNKKKRPVQTWGVLDVCNEQSMSIYGHNEVEPLLVFVFGDGMTASCQKATQQFYRVLTSNVSHSMDRSITCPNTTDPLPPAPASCVPSGVQTRLDRLPLCGLVVKIAARRYSVRTVRCPLN